MTTSTRNKRNAKPRAVDMLSFWLARGAMLLPSRILRAPAGGGVVRRDGYTLDAGLQFILATDPNARKPWPEDPLRLRAAQDRTIVSIRGRLPEVHTVRDLEVSGAEGPLAARHYATDQVNAPLLVYFHGGGFVFGNLETHDAACRLLCNQGGFHVLAVEYRLVPEHRFPAAIHDAEAAFAWALKHAKELGADPARVGVGGDSAGANLSAVLSLQTRGTSSAPACQILIYPPTDRTRAHPSMNSLAEGFLLTRASVEWFHAQYAASVGADSSDPRISPLLAPDLHGLPPALIAIAGFDPLRDEGTAYAAALEAAGVPTVLRCFEGLVHGFVNLTGFHAPSRDAVIAIAGATRALFEAGAASKTRQAYLSSRGDLGRPRAEA